MLEQFRSATCFIFIDSEHRSESGNQSFLKLNPELDLKTPTAHHYENNNQTIPTGATETFSFEKEPSFMPVNDTSIETVTTKVEPESSPSAQILDSSGKSLENLNDSELGSQKNLGDRKPKVDGVDYLAFAQRQRETVSNDLQYRKNIEEKEIASINTKLSEINIGRSVRIRQYVKKAEDERLTDETQQSRQLKQLLDAREKEIEEEDSKLEQKRKELQTMHQELLQAQKYLEKLHLVCEEEESLASQIDQENIQLEILLEKKKEEVERKIKESEIAEKLAAQEAEIREKAEAQAAAKAKLEAAQNEKRRAEAEAKAKSEAAAKAKREAEAQAKAKAEKELAETKKKEEALQKASDSFTSENEVNQEFIANKKNIGDIKLSIVLPVAGDPGSKKGLVSLKRKIRSRLGQLTDSKRQLMEVFNDLLNVLSVEKKERYPSYLWALNFFSKTVLDQAETEASVSLDRAYPLALLCCYLMSSFSELEELLMARFYKKCPFLIGFTCTLGTEQGRKDMGWKEGESPGQYNERMAGITATWTLITSCQPLHSADVHPFPIRHSWKFLARILNTPANLLTDGHFAAVGGFWDVASKTFEQAFQKQGTKLLHAICLDLPASVKDNDFPAAKRLGLIGEEFKQNKFKALKPLPRMTQ